VKEGREDGDKERRTDGKGKKIQKENRRRKEGKEIRKEV
jgi:hypothetical protein